MCGNYCLDGIDAVLWCVQHVCVSGYHSTMVSGACCLGEWGLTGAVSVVPRRCLSYWYFTLYLRGKMEKKGQEGGGAHSTKHVLEDFGTTRTFTGGSGFTAHTEAHKHTRTHTHTYTYMHTHAHTHIIRECSAEGSIVLHSNRSMSAVVITYVFHGAAQ